MPTETTVESDNNFIGFNSRLDPSNLQPGYAQYAQNVRLQRGTAQPRKGTRRLTQTELNSLTMVGSGQYLNDVGQDNIVLVFTDRMYLYNTETQTLLGPYLFPTGRVIVDGGTVDVVQALDKLYIFRGMETNSRLGTGDTATNCGVTFTHAAVNAGATVSVTATCQNGYTHNYSIGDEVTIFNVTDSQHSSFNNSYVVTGVTGNTVFTFNYTNNTGSNINSPTQPVKACVVKCKPPLIWAGSGNLIFAPQTSIPNNIQGIMASGSVPCADFGFYFQNRIVCCIATDQLAVSDILSDVFDLTLNNFKINQGGNDKIVGVLPWVENQFLVFMSRSIYMAYVETTSYVAGTSPGVNSMITVVTTQVGCLSRKSIVSAGQFVMFLSGKGVHMLSPQLDLKLVGNTLPLSEPIDDFFDSVNFSATNKASAAYYDNRFFVSLPTGSETRNTKTLVYNTLNQAWESVDTFPNGMYQDDWAVCQFAGKRRLFLLTRFAGSTSYGGIFLTEEYDGGDEYTALNGSPVIPFVLPATIQNITGQLVPIDARLRSREYTFGNINTKRFSRVESQFNNSVGDIVQMIVRTHDPDATETILTYTFSGSSTGDSTLRPRIAMRGATMDLETVFLQGRPALKGNSVYSIVTNRNMISEE